MRSIESRIAAVRRRTKAPEANAREDGPEVVEKQMAAWLRVLGHRDEGEAIPQPKVPFWKHQSARDI